MNQSERRRYLIAALLKEQPHCSRIAIPEEREEQEYLLRALMNVRRPAPVTPDFERVQDEYLKERSRERGTVRLSDLAPVCPGIYLWQGDITRLEAGAIVNAANSGMTGCYQPCHNCIDNCIHTFAGIQLRLACAAIMRKQGREEPTGGAKLTPAFNLPSGYVIHTVGPVVDGPLTAEHERLLACCYRSCLELADGNGIRSIAFCCISTGVFMFPDRRAAEIAIQTVRDYIENTGSSIQVVFNVFKDSDREIYEELLKTERRQGAHR